MISYLDVPDADREAVGKPHPRLSGWILPQAGDVVPVSADRQ
jgi:hypothetical protein